ncbi:hypothetical protein GWK47_027493 [Chionoecetes opilio]|uniref:HAT C-terminal dimerisation domain-containing protein n=1 Tax=Chionoecetes opilio TaxID=41210 RepID=A0A8J8WDF4_CHIOP|nr:hypothetical protein GWK47_027493 [Chionoecetes opilio]
MNFLMATAIHPLFKLPVVCLLSPEKVDAMKSKLLFEITEQAVLDTSEGCNADEDEEEDFFNALRTPDPQLKRTPTLPASPLRWGKILRIGVVRNRRTSCWSGHVLHPFPCRLGDVFVKYNTAIPSSAAMERLFSQRSDVMEAKSASLTSNNFERLVIMKGNMDLLKVEYAPEDSE